MSNEVKEEVNKKALMIAMSAMTMNHRPHMTPMSMNDDEWIFEDAEAVL
jgi:hypothetical protein